MNTNTNKFTFRKLDNPDADKLFEIYSDKEAMKYRGSGPMKSIEDAVKFINDQLLETDTSLTYRKAVILEDTNELVGTVMMRFEKDNKESCEIGYSIGRKYWSNGYGSAIVQELIGYTKEKLRVSSLRAYCHADNKASSRILIKNGFALIANNQETNIEFYKLDLMV